ncbi:MAG: putative RNA methyltransferase [Pseudomonadales bacterium]
MPVDLTQSKQQSSKLACPICALPLALIYNTRRCDNAHSFDVAKEGYINLLLPQHKASRDPGDSKSMVQARSHFHDNEFYKPLAGAITNHLPTASSLADLGCGEGSYGRWFLELEPSLDYYGVDISRHGIRSAAKSLPNAAWLVASNWHLPLLDRSFDTALTIFAPIDQTELLRIVKPKGHWINVTPGSNHLAELRDCLYDTVADIDKHRAFEHWQAIDTQRVTGTMNLDQADIGNLTNMTPYAWQADRDRLLALQSRDNMTISYDFVINLFSKRSQSESRSPSI